MSKKAKSKRPARPAAKAASSKPRAGGKSNGSRPGTKTAAVAELLTRKEGCTAKEIMDLCHWPSVSVPQQARAAGLKLRSKKEGRITRYWA